MRIELKKTSPLEESVVSFILKNCGNGERFCSEKHSKEVDEIFNHYELRMKLLTEDLTPKLSKYDDNLILKNYKKLISKINFKFQRLKKYRLKYSISLDTLSILDKIKELSSKLDSFHLEVTAILGSKEAARRIGEFIQDFNALLEDVVSVIAGEENQDSSIVYNLATDNVIPQLNRIN